MSEPGLHRRASAFDAMAEAYERGRPGWPAAAIGAVAARLGLDPGASVLDLAAGTGKLTRVLAERFDRVLAVEPLEGMGNVLARAVPSALVLAGTAEAIPVGDGTMDAVFVAEAFHWFDAERAAAEIDRVLRPRGGVAVLYNRREWRAAEEAWQREVHAVFEAHRLPEDDVDPFDTVPWKEALAARFGALDEASFENVQRAGPGEIEALYASFSSLAGLAPDARAAALADLREALVRHGVRDVALRYRTVVVTARRG